MTIMYTECSKLIREETKEINFAPDWVFFNGKEINIENLVRVEE